MSSSSSGARPRSTRSSFQATFAASRRPAHKPLPEEGRRQVGGVADQQHAAVAHPLRQHRAELVDRGAGQRAVLRPVPGLEQRPHPRRIVEVLRPLAGQQHELPAAVPRAALDVGGRPPGIAPLAGASAASASADMSSGSASTTSQRSWKPRSRRAIPLASRTKELAPSAPTTQRARTVRVSSVGSSFPVSRSSWRRIVSDAPSSPSARPSATQPRCTRDAVYACRRCRARARAPAGRTGSPAPTPTWRGSRGRA